MTAPTLHPPESSSRAYAARLVSVEANLRAAARLLELDPAEDTQRLSKVIFRLASRCRGDRLGAAS